MYQRRNQKPPTLCSACDNEITHPRLLWFVQSGAKKNRKSSAAASATNAQNKIISKKKLSNTSEPSSQMQPSSNQDTPKLDVKAQKRFYFHDMHDLVEQHPRIDVWETLKDCHGLEQSSTLSINGTRVALTWDEPMQGHGHGKPVPRPWFECPRCHARCRHLYLRQMACRACCKLDYTCRHRGRGMPLFARVIALRRKIGAEPRPFGSLPLRKGPRRRKILVLIRRFETNLISLLRTRNDRLEHYVKRHGLM